MSKAPAQDSHQLHLNLGGFYDARPDPIEKGWRGSLLAETTLGRFRPCSCSSGEMTWLQATSKPQLAGLKGSIVTPFSASQSVQAASDPSRGQLAPPSANRVAAG